MQFDEKILKRLNEIGIALSREPRTPVLLEKILLSAKELTAADGGTIYMVTPQRTVHFEIALSSSLGFHMGGTSQIPMPFSDLPLDQPDGTPNDSLMVAYAVNHKKSINIRDAYTEKGFDFSGTRSFDKKTGYRTRSVLTIPFQNHEGDVIGGIQLINPPDEKGFSDWDVQLAESLASQAGIALTNQILIQNLKKLFESLIGVIAEAIDEKSPSTGNHSKRVPLLTTSLAEAVSEEAEGPLKNVHYSPEEVYELKVAAFLHDCGKITTPVHVVEKKRKLETIFDRIELIKMRYLALLETMKSDTDAKKLKWFELNFPREFNAARENFSLLDAEYQNKVQRIKEEKTWLEEVNRQHVPIDENATEKLNQIALRRSVDHIPLLTPDELENLSVRRGNLTDKERAIIEQHVVMTYRMLSQLEYPKELRRVTEIAASHHERVDGKGYPRGLKKEEIPLGSRILTVADVFESLSAPDRPYREAVPLSKVFAIMQEMVTEGHLDPDVYDIFIKKKVYLPYAQRFLTPDQIDTD